METLSLSPGWVPTVCVCEPRQVCTLATSFGFLMSLMSNTRMPRTRTLLTGSGTPPKPQSSRLFGASDDMKIRFLNTDTSFCDAGQTYVCTIVGLDGFETSNTPKTLEFPSRT